MMAYSDFTLEQVIEQFDLWLQIYGAVATVTNWRLLTLMENQLQISSEEYFVLPQLPLILGFRSAPFTALIA